jgi:hypothetical protein
MPPASPPTPTHPSHHFDNAHPIQLTTWRPKTWYALETSLEFVISGYCLWAAFYLIYISICFSVWAVRKVKDWMNPWRMVGRERKTMESGRLERGYVRRWWRNLRRGRREAEDVEMEKMTFNKKLNGLDGADDWDERSRVRRRTY